jgi:hypothetical protein
MFPKFNPVYNKISLLIILCIALIPVIGFVVIRWLGGHIEQSAQLGDTVGGLMGPFIAICASFLTFIAFLVQFEANQQQKEDLEIERFESKFIELINLHKQNVIEMKLENGKHGREVFVSLFYELKLANNLIEETNKKNNLLNIQGCSFLAYKIFFFGLGKNSEKQYKLDSEESSIKDELKAILDHYKNGNDVDRMVRERLQKKEWELLTSYFEALDKENTFLFDGHISLLSHYYRHLFLTVRYVVEQLPKSIKGNEKEEKIKEYLRILRAQLSNHEQILLYYNGSSIANAWFEKGYFTKYRMIHNLPLPLADFGLKPNEHPEIIKWRKESPNDNLFEWDG